MENSLSNNRRSQWNLIAPAFERLLSALDANNREVAGQKYLRLRTDLVRFFEGRGFAEADEAADEVCNRLARKLETGDFFADLNQYAYGVARYLLLELRRAQLQKQKVFAELSNQEIPAEQKDDERLNYLNQSLGELSPENRDLILNYYQAESGSEKIEHRRRLAEKLGVPANALQNRIVRLRRKLKSLISQKIKNENYSDRFLPVSSVKSRGE